MGEINDALHADAIGLRLCRIDRKDDLLLYEGVTFTRGRSAVETILRRANICGHVEIEGDVDSHFADVLINSNGDFDQTVCLDQGSFNYLMKKLRPRRNRIN